MTIDNCSCNKEFEWSAYAILIVFVGDVRNLEESVTNAIFRMFTSTLSMDSSNYIVSSL